MATTPRWGEQTQRAIDNFPVSGERVPVPVVRWLGRLKAGAARANGELGVLDAELAERIAAAGDTVAIVLTNVGGSCGAWPVPLGDS